MNRPRTTGTALPPMAAAILVLLLACGCDPKFWLPQPKSPTTQPASTQPASTQPATTQWASTQPAASQPDEPVATVGPGPDGIETSTTEPDVATTAPDVGPVAVGPAIPEPQPAPPEAAPPPTERGPESLVPGPVPKEPTARVNLPPGTRAELLMSGRGLPPPVGTPAIRQRAAVQAAIFVAIYHVTKEINELTYSDKIDGGYVSHDHYRYTAGLEVKSQTVVVNGKPTQFDVWLALPGKTGPGKGPDKLEAHVRNFVLEGPPLNDVQLARVLELTGGHLAVTRLTGPDKKGAYEAEVALLRRR